MNSVQALSQRLSAVFEPGQAQLLAEVINESYSELVKTSDFSELKSIVGELAQAQGRTEQRVEQLAEAQGRTEQRVEELAQAQGRTEKELRNLARQVGGLSESFGGSLEDFALDLVPDILETHWQLECEEAGRAEFEVDGKSIEVDLYIEGTIAGRPVIVLGEVKSNLTLSEVERFLEVAHKIRDTHPEFGKSELRIIFFGYRAKKEAREAILQAGAYMIFTHGKML